MFVGEKNNIFIQIIIYISNNVVYFYTKSLKNKNVTSQHRGAAGGGGGPFKCRQMKENEGGLKKAKKVSHIF